MPDCQKSPEQSWSSGGLSSSWPRDRNGMNDQVGGGVPEGQAVSKEEHASPVREGGWCAGEGRLAVEKETRK